MLNNDLKVNTSSLPLKVEPIKTEKIDKQNEKLENEGVDSNKLESKITKDGVLVKYNGKEKLIEIDGDGNVIKDAKEGDSGPLSGVSYAIALLSSLMEGGLKGLGVALLNVAYPLVPTIIKSIEGYNKVLDEIMDYGVKNDLDIKKAAAKGALVGGVKGFLDGVLDFGVIGGLTLLGVMLLGPVGFALAPVIGAVYNVTKDEIRSDMERNREKREPYLPFPPEKSPDRDDKKDKKTPVK